VIRVSLNELAVRVSRALQGLGIPAGIADDAAAVVAWHDIAGLDGLGQLCAAIPRLRTPAETAPESIGDAGGRSLGTDGASLLMLGGSLVDVLECGHANGPTPVTLRGARDASLVGGVAALAADRNLAATFEAAGDDATYRAIADGHHVWWAAMPLTDGGGLTVGDIRCWPTAERTTWPPANAHHVLDSATLAERRHGALTHGVPVVPDAWAEIYERAKQILVDDSGS